MLPFWTLFTFCGGSVKEWIILWARNAWVFVDWINYGFVWTWFAYVFIFVEQGSLSWTRYALCNVRLVSKCTFWTCDAFFIDRIISRFIKRTWYASGKIIWVENCSNGASQTWFWILIIMRLIDRTWEALDYIFWINVLVWWTFLALFCLEVILWWIFWTSHALGKVLWVENCWNRTCSTIPVSSVEKWSIRCTFQASCNVFSINVTILRTFCALLFSGIIQRRIWSTPDTVGKIRLVKDCIFWTDFTALGSHVVKG